MAERKVLFVKGAAGVPTYTGSDDRRQHSAAFGGIGFGSFVAGQGAIGRGHGVLSQDSLAVTANGTPNNTVHVSAGIGCVRGTQATTQGLYVVANDADKVLTVTAAHATLQRRDLVIAKVRDGEYPAFANNDWVLEITAGTAGSGTDPTVPADALVLARLIVDPGSTIIGAEDITDLRPHTRATGGVTPVSATSAWPSPQQDDLVWDRSAGAMKRYSGSLWETVATNLDAPWISYTPTFANTTIDLAFGGSRYGRYQRFGKTIVGVAGFTLGAGGSMNGPLTMSLPVNASTAGGTNVTFMAGGRCFDNSAAVFHSCTGQITPTTFNNLVFNFATAGTAPWGVGIPIPWAANDVLQTFFNYEAA